LEIKEMVKALRSNMRILGLDNLRGLAILFMIIDHFSGYFLYRHLRSEIFLEIGAFAAPIFLFLVGTGLIISKSHFNTNRQFLLHQLKRALIILAIGFSLYFTWWGFEILHMIGLMILITLPLLYLPKIVRVVTGFGIILLTPLLIDWLNPSGISLISGSIVFIYIREMLTNGLYPIFPYLWYVILGTVVGELLLFDKKDFKTDLFFILLLVFLVSTAVSSPYPIFRLSLICVLTLWLLTRKHEIVKVVNRILKPIGDLGRFSLSIYVWHLLLGGFIAHVFSRNNLDYYGYVLFTFCFVVMTWILIVLYQKKWRIGPLETIIKKLS
jgi:uncharacterized membrane protein